MAGRVNSNTRAGFKSFLFQGYKKIYAALFEISVATHNDSCSRHSSLAIGPRVLDHLSFVVM